MNIPINSKRVTLYYVMTDSSTGDRRTGLTAANMTLSYARSGSAAVSVTPVALASPSAPWTAGGWIEVNATAQPGLYRFDVPDAAFALGVDKVEVTADATGVLAETKEIFLVPPTITEASVGATITNFADRTEYVFRDSTVRVDYK